MKKPIVVAAVAAVGFGLLSFLYSDTPAVVPETVNSVASSAAIGPHVHSQGTTVSPVEVARPPVAVSTALPLEPDALQVNEQAQADVVLWQEDSESDLVIDGIPATRLRAEPKQLQQLHVGQTVTLPVAAQGQDFVVKLVATHNDPGGVKVWNGVLADAKAGEAVIITQGKIETHVVLASERGTFTAVINNTTGVGTLIDEGEINERQLPIDDGVVLAPTDEDPLPPRN